MANPDRPRRSTGRTLSDRRREELKEKPYDMPSEIDLTPEHLEFFRTAGASEIFLTAAQADPEEFEISRNAVRSEVQKTIFYGQHEEAHDQYQLPGDLFYHELWEGNLYEAYCQGTLDTASLLKSVFGEERINAGKPADAPKISDLSPGHFFICTNPMEPLMDI